MEKFVVTGGTPLKGEVTISGAKNAAIAILPAALLIEGVCTIDNLPNISDVRLYVKIIESLGAKVTWINEHKIELDTTNISFTDETLDITRKFRASYYLLGSMLGRFKSAQVGLPGGCNLGARPIDLHIKGFEALGAEVEIANGNITAKREKLVGTPIYLDFASVGATINIMLASVLAEGVTIIENAAKEPHVVDVANFLNTMGADIRGAGTDIIKIHGVKKLTGNKPYSIVPDQIEAGTFMIAAVATRGDVIVKNCVSHHLDPLIAKLTEAGANIELLGNSIHVWCDHRPVRTNIKTLPYPGFPTDLQPQMGVLLSVADGTSIINETIWESRFQYTSELNKMGTHIIAQGQSAVFDGVDKIYGAPVYSTDLRAGAALIIAGCVAEGQTEIYNIEHIDRGYEKIEDKFSKLGANITRVEE